MDKKLRRILDLVQRTGDRVVITNPEGEDAFVVMALEDYEVLVELEQLAIESTEYTQGEDSVQNEKMPPAPEHDPRLVDVMQSANSNSPTWNLSEMSAKERGEVESQFMAQSKSRTFAQTISPEVVIEPIITPINHGIIDDEDLGEQQFYLEPIE